MTPSSARAPRRKAAAPAAAKPARPFIAHRLAPPHEILSEEETQRILQELETVPERLPKILLGDPGLLTDPKFTAARDAGERLVGRLVRIRRPSATAGEAVAYRLIVVAAGGS
ncbi:MAG TPA: DNA-directed RNA polymerase subunit RpoH/Rpb5 C-terminal domain-containing protein [Thermoplasmata archaeon]|nr:DNA-directed RNA polymerase subunit RpoH/Rpb5 C-terminal domain-containing protein [Thermoplasmata archaeon]